MLPHVLRLLLPAFLLTGFSITAKAQQILKVMGTVTDSTGQPLADASVSFRFGSDSLFTRTQSSGQFSANIKPVQGATITVSMVGFQSITGPLPLTGTGYTLSLDTLKMNTADSELEDVVITAYIPVKVMEDTVQYAAGAFKVREGAMAEEMIKKLPGIEVDKDGNITSQGKKVARIRVNGKDFFGGDVQTATQNIPADVLENIQVIEDYGEEARLSGVKTGEPETIININIQKSKNRGNFGYAKVGGGTEGRYLGGFMINRFRDEQQLSLVGSVNNTNTGAFNFGNEGRGGGNGLSNNQSIGLNYRDVWGKKMNAYGSYSFTNRNNITESRTYSQDINPQNNRNTYRLNQGETSGTNHRFNFNVEYRIDSVNFLKVSPTVTLSQTDNSNNSLTEINRKKYYTLNKGSNNSSTSAPSAALNMVYNHRFNKKGKNFSFSTNLNYNDRTQETDRLNTYRNIDSGYLPPSISDTLQQQLSNIGNRSFTSQVKMAYKTPLFNSNRFLEVSYEWRRAATDNDRTVYDILQPDDKLNFNDQQSNYYDFQFITNNAGLLISERYEKFNYQLGVHMQPSLLTGNSIGKEINTHYTNMNWIPNARFVYNFDKNHNLTATYGGRSREPNFNQLQPVADSSNLNNIVVGNPDLQADFTSNFSIKYNKSDRKTGRLLTANFNYDKTNNKIVTYRVNNPSGTGRTTTYINTDGFYHLAGDASITRPFSNRKFSATLRMNASFDNNISYTDGQRNNGQNWNLRPSARFRVDIQDIVDLNLNGGYTYYKTTTNYKDYSTTNTAKTLSIGLDGKHYFFKDLTLGYEIDKRVNYGFGQGIAANPMIINVFTEYRFLKGKKANVRLQAFDLLDQNKGISRTVNETTITDSNVNRLGRYLLLTFTYRMQKFSGGSGGGGNRMPRMNPNRF